MGISTIELLKLISSKAIEATECYTRYVYSQNQETDDFPAVMREIILISGFICNNENIDVVNLLKNKD